ncbi:MAG: hypothetical protein JWL77_57 [Chthonomonadaceae bacterium]|nr:hypothetical protein [Chthonomonadaceae bacterium]
MKAETLYRAFMPYKQIIETLALSMRKHPSVVGTHSGVELRHYESGPIIEAYVEAELSNGNAVTWWLDVRPSGKAWSFEARILGNDDRGEITLHVFPTVAASSVQGCVKAFHHAIMEGKWIDFYATQISKDQLQPSVAILILALSLTLNRNLGETVANYTSGSGVTIASDPNDDRPRFGSLNTNLTLC